jgi:hypothetical protein
VNQLKFSKQLRLILLKIVMRGLHHIISSIKTFPSIKEQYLLTNNNNNKNHHQLKNQLLVPSMTISWVNWSLIKQNLSKINLKSLPKNMIIWTLLKMKKDSNNWEIMIWIDLNRFWQVINQLWWVRVQKMTWSKECRSSIFIKNNTNSNQN